MLQMKVSSSRSDRTISLRSSLQTPEKCSNPKEYTTEHARPEVRTVFTSQSAAGLVSQTSPHPLSGVLVEALLAHNTISDTPLVCLLNGSLPGTPGPRQPSRRLTGSKSNMLRLTRRSRLTALLKAYTMLRLWSTAAHVY